MRATIRPSTSTNSPADLTRLPPLAILCARGASPGARWARSIARRRPGGDPMDASTSSRERALAAAPFFGRLPSSELVALAGLLHPRRVAAGERIFEAGDPGDA